MPLQISEDELQIVRNILSTHLPNIPVWAYGSRVKDKATPYSDLDLDLALITETPLDFVSLAKLEQAFSDSDLTWQVDLLDWATAGDAFKQIIKQNYVVLQ